MYCLLKYSPFLGDMLVFGGVCVFFGWFPQVQDKNKKHIIISFFFSPKKWHLDSPSDKFPYISTIRKIETRAHLKKSWNWTPTRKKLPLRVKCLKSYTTTIHLPLLPGSPWLMTISCTQAASLVFCSRNPSQFRSSHHPNWRNEILWILVPSKRKDRHPISTKTQPVSIRWGWTPQPVVSKRQIDLRCHHFLSGKKIHKKTWMKSTTFLHEGF